MAEETESGLDISTDTPATESVGDVEPSGNDVTDAPTGQSAATAPANDELPREKIVSSKHYKELQAEFTRRSQAMSELERKFQPYGGAESILGQVQSLQGNPEFIKFMESQKMKQGGLDPSTLEPEAKAALDYIQSEIDRKVKSEIAPIMEKHRAAQVAENFGAMTEKYGAEWQELMPAMREVAATLSPSEQNSNKFETLEYVYIKAMMKSGKFEEFSAKQYERQLANKKAKSTSRPSVVAGGSRQAPKINNMMDAYNAAKTMLG